MIAKKEVTKSMSKASVGTMVAAGAAVAAAGGALGYYFYGSQDAITNRKTAARWAQKLRSDVVKEIKSLEKINQKQLFAIISSAAGQFESMKKVDSKDVMSAVKELKSHWKDLIEEVKVAPKSVKKQVANEIVKVKKVSEGQSKKVAKKVVAKK